MFYYSLQMFRQFRLSSDSTRTVPGLCSDCPQTPLGLSLDLAKFFLGEILKDIGLSLDSQDCPRTPLGLLRLSSESLWTRGCRVKYCDKGEIDNYIFKDGKWEMKSDRGRLGKGVQMQRTNQNRLFLKMKNMLIPYNCSSIQISLFFKGMKLGGSWIRVEIGSDSGSDLYLYQIQILFFSKKLIDPSFLFGCA